MDKERKSQDTGQKEKIILPENLQREIIKFFLKTSIPKLAEINKEENQLAPENKKRGADEK